MNLAIAKGKLRPRDNQLIVDTELNSFNNFFILFFIILLVFSALGIMVMLLSENGKDEGNMSVAIGLQFLVVHATFMLGIPYLFMRRSTNRMKYDLTREFHYLAQLRILQPYNWPK
jgi:hypothetical protein